MNSNEIDKDKIEEKMTNNFIVNTSPQKYTSVPRDNKEISPNIGQ